MDIGAILLLVALLLGVGLYLAAPLFDNRTRRPSAGTQETSSLMAERDRIINALRELDFDFRLGKIPEEDYPVQRTDLLQKGAEVLKKLDALAPSSPLRPSPTGRENGSEGNNAEDRLEKAVAARRADAAKAKAASVSDDDIESLLAARRKEHKTKSAGFCPRCGKSVMVSDHFCPSCGKALT
ncbi:MAG: zinc ribbon domain-containing protein [Chloroflexi bacterium]|nr:zinc ribbon domain-containing protein [Chloroflexota bacterium]